MADLHSSSLPPLTVLRDFVPSSRAMRGTLQERPGLLKWNQRLEILIAKTPHHESKLPPWALGLTLLHPGPIVKCEHIKEDVEISLLVNLPAGSLTYSSLQAQPIPLQFQQG